MKPGDSVIWFKQFPGRPECRKIPARVLKIHPTRISIEFKDSDGQRQVRHVLPEQVEKLKKLKEQT